MQVEAEHEFEGVGAFERACGGLSAQLQAGSIAVAAIEDLAFEKDDRFALAVCFDVLGEVGEVLALQERKENELLHPVATQLDGVSQGCRWHPCHGQFLTGLALSEIRTVPN